MKLALLFSLILFLACEKQSFEVDLTETTEDLIVSNESFDYENDGQFQINNPDFSDDSLRNLVITTFARENKLTPFIVPFKLRFSIGAYSNSASPVDLGLVSFNETVLIAHSVPEVTQPLFHLLEKEGNLKDPANTEILNTFYNLDPIRIKLENSSDLKDYETELVLEPTLRITNFFAFAKINPNRNLLLKFNRTIQPNAVFLSLSSKDPSTIRTDRSGYFNFRITRETNRIVLPKSIIRKLYELRSSNVLRIWIGEETQPATISFSRKDGNSAYQLKINRRSAHLTEVLFEN